ncbi:MAG: glycosyltransferase [Ignavibacteriales bacterium]|nr:glycosyltransferase [Ignavibacteriales bacterium]MCB9210992.1 glycosyltransferase [Ignavibacteriales bacterium]
MQKNLIHFSGDDFWNSNPHSRYHMVKSWHSMGYKILWLNPIGHRFPSISKKGFSKRIIRKLKSYTKFLKKVDDNFYVYTPFLIPKFSKGFLQIVNLFLLKFQVSILKIFLSLKKPLFFITTPMFGDALKISHSKSIYYYSDKYTSYRELSAENKKYMENLDKQLYQNADLICCASKNIYNDIKKLTVQPVIYIPHVVNFKYFNDALGDKYIPKDIIDISKPIVGYYGTLTKSTDWEIIEYCVKERPNYNYVLIGRDEVNYEGLKNLKNIIFLGKKDFKEIPHYGKMFDVCISPFIQEEWIQNSSPLKIKEYLSLEKPVVSTYIEEVQKLYSQIVYIAKDKFEFLNYIDLNIKKPNKEKIELGKELVKLESWDNVVRELNATLKN